MTTEDDFQKMLDLHPEDWQTRLIFADWLEERNNPLAIGYRILGLHRIVPYRSSATASWVYCIWGGNFVGSLWEKHLLPEPIDYEMMCDAGGGEGHGFSDLSRRALEDRAARAIAALPPERKAELLQQELSQA